ncbi:MAG: hypothetical protein L3J28_11705 [Candidatus Polarisedimenticolaceae bacterium]|nr:hypothetical protein [Candidatus Polarisedimenticolaceae bacterium]
MSRNYKIDLAIKNLTLAEGLSANITATHDSQLWRGPRLLVPVELDVLVVDESNKDDAWANVLFRPENIAGYSEERANSQGGEATESDAIVEGENPTGGRIPFDIYQTREQGIYLHWSLPDGLTQGTTISDNSPEKTATLSKHEQDDEEVTENTQFPLVPDRWLVVRFSPGSSASSKRRFTAWVIKSEEADKADRVVPLGQFREDRDNNSDRWFTAIGEGDPGYAAYYDNVEGMLGFYDDMSGISHGPISYLVTGWYSEKDDDPLYAPTAKESWREKLNQLGWAISDETEEDLAAAAEQRKFKARLAGLAVDYSDASELVLNPRYDVTAAASATERSLNLEPKSGEKSLFSSSILNITHQLENEIPTIEVGYLADIAQEAFIALDYDFLNHWPRQILCHSMTYSVRWGGQGGRYEPENAGKPQAESLSISVGNTGVEALSALLSERAGHKAAERIYNGYHYGLLPELQQQDGLATLESLLHAEDFESQPGGFILDSISQGDLFPKLSSTETVRTKYNTIDASSSKVDALKTATLEERAIESRFYIHRDEIVQAKDALLKARDPFAFEKPIKPREKITIRKAMPRYWQPKDPIILFSEAKRGYKHGEDSRLSEDGYLLCRVTGETVTSVGIQIGQEVHLSKSGQVIKTLHTVQPRDLSISRLQSGQLPPESHALFDEALLLDLDNASIAAQHIIDLRTAGTLAKQYPAEQIALDDFNIAEITQQYQVQVTLQKNITINPVADVQTLTTIDTTEGRQPAEFAQKPWRKPWTPLHMDWQVEWLPNANHRTDWQLDQHDYETTKENDSNAQDREIHTYKGSTLLTPAVTRSMADRLSKFIDDEELAEAGSADDIATDSQKEGLDEIRSAFETVDVLSGNLSGFHDYLLAQVDDYQFDPLVNHDGVETIEKGLDQLEKEKRTISSMKKFPVRAGHFRLTKLRIVDAFGQYVDLSDATLGNPIKAEDMQSSPATPDLMRLPPRIVQPSRLMFRMIQAANEQKDATKEISPICGWLLPDHLDEALEVYDDQGNSLGQVQRQRPKSGDIITTSLEWQGVPGDPGSFGAPPKVDNSHLQGFIDGLLAAGEHDAQRALNPTLDEDAPSYSKDTALGAMLRMIDSTLWSVDPLGREGDEHLSVLVGRPLAVVRASLRLETKDIETQGDLSSTAFDVRLGELTRLGDGLIGYFINDDYSQFYPIHEEIANQTRPSRPHHGYLGAIQTTKTYYTSFAGASAIEPVKHPYINEAPVVKVRPVAPGKADPASKSVMLTLIIDPRGGVHATCGILPRKKIELLREHVATALENISITFRIGPILSNPETIRMPLPSEIQGNWSWVRKSGLTVWDERPVVDAVPEPKLTHTAAQIQEGWLKLSKAQTAEEES